MQDVTKGVTQLSSVLDMGYSSAIISKMLTLGLQRLLPGS